MPWNGTSQIEPRQFRCGHCGLNVANNKGYFHDGRRAVRVYVCPNCDEATVFDQNGRANPGATPGNEVLHLPADLDALYRESRNCCSVAAYTSSVLASRKLLMNIAVAQDAKEGLRFIEYVEYLAEKGYIPPNGKAWVDHIRKRGNEATHEIALMTDADAEELIAFTEMLLKFVYEFPNRVPGDT